MCRMFGKLARGLAVAVVAIGVVFIVGMRTKSRPVLDAVRRFNRAVGNPHQMETAGTPGAYASVIHHVGRTSGTAYETPVGAVATDAGFMIALPYGSRADWLQNVLASGSATIDDEGGTYPVDRPVVVPLAEVADAFPANDRRMMKLFGVDECLVVRRVDSDA